MLGRIIAIASEVAINSLRFIAALLASETKREAILTLTVWQSEWPSTVRRGDKTPTLVMDQSCWFDREPPTSCLLR
jgi:hypothetical protein